LSPFIAVGDKHTTIAAVGNKSKKSGRLAAFESSMLSGIRKKGIDRSQ